MGLVNENQPAGGQSEPDPTNESLLKTLTHPWVPMGSRFLDKYVNKYLRPPPLKNLFSFRIVQMSWNSEDMLRV